MRYMIKDSGRDNDVLKAHVEIVGMNRFYF